MLLSYNELCEIVEQGVITNVKPEQINATSIDLTLADTLLLEWKPANSPRAVDLMARQSVTYSPMSLEEGDCRNNYYDMRPGQFLLAATQQMFNLPDDISAEYSLKSSLARNGLGHMLAGWIDPGFHNSVLTLELKNETQFNYLRLTVGMPIGQVKFFRHKAVPPEQSYRNKGRYNNDSSVQNIKK